MFSPQVSLQNEVAAHPSGDVQNKDREVATAVVINIAFDQNMAAGVFEVQLTGLVMKALGADEREPVVAGVAQIGVKR